jgi:uncharacterized protein (DUF433 family)
MSDGLIVCNPEILSGKPIVKGTRISVGLILQCLASGMTREDILRGYPTLTPEGLDAALDFAALRFEGEQTEHQRLAEASRAAAEASGVLDFVGDDPLLDDYAE